MTYHMFRSISKSYSLGHLCHQHIQPGNTSSGGNTRSRPEKHRAAATRALLLLVNTNIELRIDFTLYQQRSTDKRAADQFHSVSAAGSERSSRGRAGGLGGRGRGSEGVGSRGVARHHHLNQPASQSGPARRQ
uniref:Uncharacterized protein n=1 Tax=Triticum urartu TaxID=4572 RepID=A0A8R7UAS4_TRIUA